MIYFNSTTSIYKSIKKEATHASLGVKSTYHYV
jgi:hypothetical protein